MQTERDRYTEYRLFSCVKESIIPHHSFISKRQIKKKTNSSDYERKKCFESSKHCKLLPCVLIFNTRPGTILHGIIKTYTATRKHFTRFLGQYLEGSPGDLLFSSRSTSAATLRDDGRMSLTN